MRRWWRQEPSEGDDYSALRARLRAETLRSIDESHEKHVRYVCASAIVEGYERDEMLAYDDEG